jgi:predicted RNA binding protein YcfA (HicA-like mRNA interferase family)
VGNAIPVFSSKQLIKALKKLGFTLEPGKGSHTKMKDPKTHQALTVPKNKHFGIGLRNAIIKDLEAKGIKRETLYKLLTIGVSIALIEKLLTRD